MPEADDELKVAYETALEIEKAPPVQLTMGAKEALVLVGALQALLRHPASMLRSTDPGERAVKAITVQIARMLTGVGPRTAELIAQGWTAHNEYVAGARIAGGSPLDDYSRAHVGEIIEDADREKFTNFNAHLLRLIKKADGENRAALALIYPDHVKALQEWESAPLKVPGGFDA